MTTIAVLIATFGSPRWRRVAQQVALPSVEAQTSEPDEIIVLHRSLGLLHDARNAAVESAASEWLCFLDADDRLHPDYIAAMRSTIDSGDGERLLTPAIERDGVVRLEPPRESIWHGNWLVIGTLIPTSLFEDCDGFWDEPAWEDWSLFIRAIELGALVVTVPDAVYEASPSSGRNIAARPYHLGESIRRANREWLADRFHSERALAEARVIDEPGLTAEAAR